MAAPTASTYKNSWQKVFRAQHQRRQQLLEVLKLCAAALVIMAAAAV
jgi:hypothetical protein